MVNDRSFSLRNARHAVRSDGVEVEFINSNEVRYTDGRRSIIFQAERFIAADGAPDGRIIMLDDKPHWENGDSLLPAEMQQIWCNLDDAAIILQSRFRRPGER